MFSEFSSCSFFCLHCRGCFTLQSNIFSCYYTIIIYGYFSFTPCRRKSSFDEVSPQETTDDSSAKVRKFSFSEALSRGNIHKTMCLIPMIRYGTPSLARALERIFAHSLLTKRLYDLQIWMILSIFASEIGHENVWAPRWTEHEAGCRRVQAHAASGTTI